MDINNTRHLLIFSSSILTFNVIYGLHISPILRDWLFELLPNLSPGMNGALRVLIALIIGMAFVSIIFVFVKRKKS